MIFTLFLPKAPPETIRTLQIMFNMILSWLAREHVRAHLSAQPIEEAEDERTD